MVPKQSASIEEKLEILTADIEDSTTFKITEKLNDQVKLEKLNDQVKLEESKARFDKWKESSKNLDKLINSSMSSRSKFGLGFGETFGSDEEHSCLLPTSLTLMIHRSAYVLLYRNHQHFWFSAGRAVPAVNQQASIFNILEDLAVITNCTWIREDGELLLRPQQVVLGKLKGHICSGDLRTMDNPHKNKDLGIVDSGCSRSMT
ncbi:hypothetical protein Tco_0537148, partial [Tanacetum coccineum]